jgi:hypothetical protein
MATTAEDVWQILAEVTTKQAELASAQKETERRFQELERFLHEQSQETREQFQETREQFQEDRQHFQELERRRDAESQKTEREIREVNKQIKEVSKQIGNLGGKWGRFVENMVAPACETLFLKRGIPVHQVSQRVKRRLDGQTLEIDVLVINEDHVLVVEVKSSLGVDNIKELMEDLSQFRLFFPEYAQKQLHGAVAGIEIEEGADKYAYRQGLFVLAQAGEAIAILNNLDFQPKCW